MSSSLHPALLFVGKSVAFAVILWTVTCFLQNLNRPSQAEGAGQAAQNAAYDRQMLRQERLLAESERQQQRMNAQLQLQERQSERMDKVLQAWERQAGIAR